MRGRRFAGGADQAGLQQVQVARIRALELHRHVRLVLVHGVLEEVGAGDLSTLQIDVETEHIRDDAYGCRGTSADGAGVVLEGAAAPAAGGGAGGAAVAPVGGAEAVLAAVGTESASDFDAAVLPADVVAAAIVSGSW